MSALGTNVPVSRSTTGVPPGSPRMASILLEGSNRPDVAVMDQEIYRSGIREREQLEPASPAAALQDHQHCPQTSRHNHRRRDNWTDHDDADIHYDADIEVVHSNEGVRRLQHRDRSSRNNHRRRHKRAYQSESTTGPTNPVKRACTAEQHGHSSKDNHRRKNSRTDHIESNIEPVLSAEATEAYKQQLQANLRKLNTVVAPAVARVRKPSFAVAASPVIDGSRKDTPPHEPSRRLEEARNELKALLRSKREERRVAEENKPGEALHAAAEYDRLGAFLR